jgi:hypothetical protein
MSNTSCKLISTVHSKMHMFVWIIILVAFVFLLTYDPKSCTLEKYITPKKETVSTQKPTECSSERYQQLQFNSSPSDGSACRGEPIELMGAVIRA